jgi:GAF domain/Domain of unknown function (DUF4118)
LNTAKPRFPFTIRDWPAWAQHVLALSLVALAMVGRGLLDPALGDRLPYLTVFLVLLPLVILVRPTPFLVAALAGMVGAIFLFMSPRFSLRIDGPQPILQAGLFLATAATAFATAWLSERVQRAQRGDAEALARLYEVGALCAQPAAEQWACLDAILVAAIELAGEGKGNIQVLDRATGHLRIAAHRGFSDEFLDFFKVLQHDTAASCGHAQRTGARVIVPDVEQSPIFAGTRSLDVLLRAGVRACVSTPLVSSSGWMVGMLNVHFSRPRSFEQPDFKWLDVLARQAADYIERKQAEAQTTARLKPRTLAAAS